MGPRDAQLRHDIEEHRERIGDTLVAIGDRVSPGRMAERRKAAMQGAFARAKETVMGSAGDMQSNVTSTMSDASEAVRNAPHAVAERSQGNPVAAGLIAFGAGMLLAALLPKTDMEQQAAGQLQPQIQGALDSARDVGRELASSAKDDVQQASIDLRETARDATQHVKEEAKHGAGDVRATATDATQQVQRGQ